MFDKAKYINSRGQEIIFGKKSIYINENDLRDYKWTYAEDNGQLTTMSRSITSKTIPIIITCQSEQEGISIKNRVFEVFEVDLVSKKMGKLFVNDYYLPCYVVESKKSNYLFRNSYLELTITLITDFGYWCKEFEQYFYAAPKEIEYIEEMNAANESIVKSDGKGTFPFDFPFDFAIFKKGVIGKKYMFGFPFDFKQNFNIKNFVNEHYTACEFRLYIFGACMNPAIYISGHLYEIQVSLSDGDYLIVDSRERTIVKYGKNGDMTNFFNKRNKQSDIFKKIESGSVSIRWSATFAFKLVILQERSEPPWR